MTDLRTVSLLAIVAVAAGLTGCGRDVTQSDVKLLGVGSNPDEIGPSPKAYGGLLELNHVGFRGGALPLAAMGLSSFSEAGPELVSIAPPYEAVFGLTYVFDTKLRGTTSFTLVMPNPPVAEGACYTQVHPDGPFDSGFNTVDVGDYVVLRNVDTGVEAITFDRFPRDYPPEASRLSVSYQIIQGYSPEERTRFVPDPNGSIDPRDMVEVPYRPRNFPFGAGMTMEWPGGFTTFDKPVGSVPLPYRPSEPTLTLPESLGPVKMDWNGPRYYYDFGAGDYVEQEPDEWSTCFEFTSPLEFGDGEPRSLEDCQDLTSPPNAPGIYNAFKGQMYTGPWETEEGVTFTWSPSEAEAMDDTLTLAVKFLAPIDRDSDTFTSRQVPLNPDDDPDEWVYRSAQVCETEEGDQATYRFDEERWAPDGSVAAVLQGDPSNVVAQVVCNVPKESGSFTLTQDLLQDAYDYARLKGAGGALFMVGRSQWNEVEIPAVKDPYDQRHDVNPMYVTAKTVQIGRFYWKGDTPEGETEGGEQ